MIRICKTFGGYEELTKIEKGCWINVVQPSSDEIQKLSSVFHIPTDVINDILDPDERSRVEFEDDWTLVIMRVPIKDENNGVPFQTIPIGIFLSEDFTLTLCNKNNDVLPRDHVMLFKKRDTQQTDSINFILRLFLRAANIYMKFLKNINQQTSMIEQDLEKSIKNRELNKLLKMEKCLVYFITSLKANEMVLSRLRTSKRITTEINEDLLDDAIIENKQALAMAQIYSDIQSGMMDAFASVISNNLNDVMKQLTLISIILMIPTLIASIFGMNVPNYMENSMMALPVIIAMSLLLSVLGVILFRRKRWF